MYSFSFRLLAIGKIFAFGHLQIHKNLWQRQSYTYIQIQFLYKLIPYTYNKEHNRVLHNDQRIVRFSRAFCLKQRDSLIYFARLYIHFLLFVDINKMNF